MLPAGKYWIGDLCYVIEDWDSFCDLTISGQTCLSGEFIFKGTPIASYNTMYGDGCYFDEEENEYCVDAGLIGCIPFDAISNRNGIDLGRVVEFEQPFMTGYHNGKIFFGYGRQGPNRNTVVTIDTGH